MADAWFTLVTHDGEHSEIIFHDKLPGCHATLFDGGGRRLAFQADLSSFDDAKRKYSWCFAMDRLPLEGEHFTFATSDRAVVGVFDEWSIEVVEESVVVERGEGGKPLGLR